MANLVHSGNETGGKSMKNAQDIASVISGAAEITALTDGSLGTASDTLPEITASYVEADIANSIASLAAKVNAIISKLGGN